jgi:hypothetical protein
LEDKIYDSEFSTKRRVVAVRCVLQVAGGGGAAAAAAAVLLLVEHEYLRLQLLEPYVQDKNASHASLATCYACIAARVRECSFGGPYACVHCTQDIRRFLTSRTF